MNSRLPGATARIRAMLDGRSSRVRTLLIPCLLYGLVSAFFCAPLFSRPHGLGFADWDQHLFYYASVIKSVAEYGQAPFWNPWYCGGNVLWQNPQVALLSPVYPLTAIMSLALAMKVNIFMHYWLGFVGMHLLLTRIIGLTFLPLVVFLASVVTAAGAPAMHLAVGHTWILSAFYLPLQFYFFLRALKSGAVRHVLLAGALLALMVYNGGFHIVPMSVAGIGMFAVSAAVLRRQWRPVMLVAVTCAAGFLYAAPKLLPVAMFVTDERFWDTRPPIENPDRMSGEMLLHAYLDPFQYRNMRFDWQQYPWHEYGNYIGGFAAVFLVSSIVWILVYDRGRERWFGVSLALTSIVLALLSAGEFGSLAPASLVRQLPVVSYFRIPSRYTVPLLLFVVSAAAWAIRTVAGETGLAGRRTQGLAAIVCVLASFDVVARNRMQLEGVFSQPSLETGFRLLKGPPALATGADADNRESPMLHALMGDRASYNCYENFQLTRTADLDNPLVFNDGKSMMFGTTFSPNRIEFGVVGGAEPSQIWLNQNYSPGWRSPLGSVTPDPEHGRPSVTLTRGQAGRFTFTFVPPGLAIGMSLLALAIVGSAFAWKRVIPDVDADPSGLPGAPDDAAHRVRDRCELLLIGVGIALLFFAVPHTMFADGKVRFDALTDLVEHGRLASIQYSFVGPIFSTPLYYAGKVAFGSEWWVARFNTLLVVGGLIATALLLHKSVDRRVLRTFLLLILAASMFPNHVRGYFGEVFTAVLVFVGIAALAAGRPMVGWAAMVVGVANTPAAMVGLLLVAIKCVYDTRSVRYFIPVLVAASLILLESWIRRGNPFLSGYEGFAGFGTVMPYSGRPAFSYPLFFGLLSIVLSFGKGLVFFAPGLLLGWHDRTHGHLRMLTRYAMWFVAGLILVYAKWWAWYGGWIWGPRFFLFASLPASLLIASKLRDARTLGVSSLVALLAVLTLSAWVGLNGAVFDQANLRICSQENYALEFLCWYTPEFSALWHPFIAPPPLSSGQWLFMAYCGLVYVWLSAPVIRTLLTHAGRLIAVRATEVRSWRF